jgi:hypothetical protein
MADRDVEKGDVIAEQERNSSGIPRRNSPHVPNHDNRVSDMTAVHGSNEDSGNATPDVENRNGNAGPHRNDGEDRTGKEPEDDGT